MSTDLIDRILATYEPVADKPGYVWVEKGKTYVKLETLREVYEEQFYEGPREKDNKDGSK